MMVEERRCRPGGRDALDAVGGSGSPAGSALWLRGRIGAVREWALRVGLGQGNRPRTRPRASGRGTGMLARAGDDRADAELAADRRRLDRLMVRLKIEG